MRRQGQYADTGVNMYAGPQMQDMTGKVVEHNFNNFEEGLEAFTPEREQPYANSEVEGQWQWENDRLRMQNPVAPHMFNEGQAGNLSRSNYPGQRPDPKLTLDKQNSNSGFQHHDGENNLMYKDNPLSKTFEGLQQKFHDEIMKLTKEQVEAEDAENTKHREKINAINTRYQEQLVALRARHAARRDEFLRRESHYRQEQYHRIIMENYTTNRMPIKEPHVYGGAAAAAGDARQSYNAAAADARQSYNANDAGMRRERNRFSGNSQGQNIGPAGAYPAHHGHGAGPRYY